MKKKIKAVQDFHNAFGLGVRNEPIANLSEQKLKLRFDLMAEENHEYLEAAKNNDLVEVADALGDMLYILCKDMKRKPIIIDGRTKVEMVTAR